MDITIAELIAYMVPVAALIVSILTFMRAAHERNAKSVQESAELALKLDHLAEMLGKVEAKQNDVVVWYRNMQVDVAEVKGHIKDLEKRLEKVEDDLKEMMLNDRG